MRREEKRDRVEIGRKLRWKGLRYAKSAGKVEENVYRRSVTPSRSRLRSPAFIRSPRTISRLSLNFAFPRPRLSSTNLSTPLIIIAIR